MVQIPQISTGGSGKKSFNLILPRCNALAGGGPPGGGGEQAGLDVAEVRPHHLLPLHGDGVHGAPGGAVMGPGSKKAPTEKCKKIALPVIKTHKDF